MTFNAKEISISDGEPVEYFEFVRGGKYWRYTSAEVDQQIGQDVYSAITISRGGYEQTNEFNRTAIKIMAPRDIEIAAQLIVAPPTEIMTVKIMREHITDTDSEIAVIWQGRVLNAEWSGSEVALTCEPIYTSLQRPGLRRNYQRQCPHQLYGLECSAPKGAFLVYGNVSAVGANYIDVAEAALQADGYYAGGFIEWGRDENTVERRLITEHTGARLTLVRGIDGPQVQDSVIIYPGCDHTLATCDAKFSNSDNYGGFPHIPGVNPFNGTKVF